MKSLTIFLVIFSLTGPIFGQVIIDTGRGGGSSGKTEVVRKESKTPPKVKRYNTFFLGDEYTDANSMIQLIQYMGIQVRKPFEIAPSKIAPPGITLETHLKNPELAKAFKDVKWNYVIIQENRDAVLEDPEKTIENGTKLAEQAKANGAIPVFFMTWAAQGSPEQSKELLKTYEQLALKNNTRMSPVGIAWERVAKVAPHIKLYREESDASYPTVHGTYLTAACLFVTIFRQSPIGQKQTGFKTLSAKDALILQQVAYKTVMDYEKYIIKKAKAQQEKQ